MTSHIKRTLGLAGVALALATTAQAQGHGHGRGGDHAARANQANHDNHANRGDGDDDDRDRSRDHDVYRRQHGDVHRGQNRDVYGNDGNYGDDRNYGNGRWVPPGLAKKPGQMPPGQYKKLYGRNQPYYGTNQGASVLSEILRSRGYPVNRVAPAGDSRYVYYRLRDGTQRRAIVSPGSNRLLFNNVPASILQAVLSRLY